MSEGIPRFVLSLTDTQTTIKGKDGEQYMQISIGSDHLSDFNKRLPKDKRKPGANTELQAMFMFFAEQVDKSNMEREDGEVKEYTQVKPKGD